MSRSPMRVHHSETANEFSIVAVDKFIQATRDSGYKGTQSAIAELVDNSLQAGATEIAIQIKDVSVGRYPVEISVADNGCGMDVFTLRQALRFGGSSRFNERSGMGRYGMGLPNSSLSQARRVTVHTWTSVGDVFRCHLDVDEILQESIVEVPTPRPSEIPINVNGSRSGTVVVWSKCDRLDNRRVTTIARKLREALGRRFRYFIWRGVKISVNDTLVVAIDPLFLVEDSLFQGATQFGDELVYEVEAGDHAPGLTGFVRVRFSELPVREWSKLSNKEKRARGIAKGAGVSIVRAGREVDYGWFFLGGKRRENYDDWWRCEVQFEPILDEAFGITHTKQQIRPQPHLLEALSEDIVSIARALNSRARKAHLAAKVSERFSASEQLAGERDDLLPQLPPEPRPRDKKVLVALGYKPTSAPKPTTSLKPETEGGAKKPRTRYPIVPAPPCETTFFNYARDGGGLVLILNPEHPFYKLVYKPLLDSDTPHEKALRAQLDLLLLAAARSEALIDDEEATRFSERLRQGWSDTLATFLNG